MMDNGAASAVDVIDPQVRIFVNQVAADFARLGPVDRLPVTEARRVAEAVRAPWRQGGPVMRSTREMSVPLQEGSVRVRIYAPQPEADALGLRAALVYMHGGGWTLFSLDTHDRVMREYAGRSGLIVIGVDYALAPENRFPVALEQVVAVVRWLRAHGDTVGVDPARIAIGGDSAGGNLSVAACLKLRDEGEGNAIAGMLLNYAAFHGRCSEEAARRYGGEGFMLGHEEMRQFWANYLRSPDDERNPLVAPMLATLDGLPPAFLAIAECDVLCEQNLEMVERLRQAGVPVNATVYPGATHSFIEAVSVADIAARALEDGARWLAERTAR